MKTAEKWLTEKLQGKHGEPQLHTAQEWDTSMLHLFKQIQLDAMKEGARRAAEICSTRGKDVYAGSNPIREGIKRGLSNGCIAILTTTEQWTEKDLI